MGMNYPATAGFKEATTSRDAAKAIDAKGAAKTIQASLLRLFEGGLALTTFEAAEWLGLPLYNTVQPRFTELKHAGKIEKAYRVDGPNGVKIWRWRLVDKPRQNVHEKLKAEMERARA